MSICGSKNKPRDNKDSGKKQTLANTTRILKVCRVIGKVFLKHKPPVSQPATVFFNATPQNCHI